MTEEIQKMIDNLEEFKAYVARAIKETDELFAKIDECLNELRQQTNRMIQK